MAQRAEQFDARKELLRVLLTKVQKDRFPSSTMMNMIEQLMGPDEQSIYAQVLMEKIERDPHPSNSMMQRVITLG
jgi:hypothetical protein